MKEQLETLLPTQKKFIAACLKQSIDNREANTFMFGLATGKTHALKVLAGIMDFPHPQRAIKDIIKYLED